MAKRRDEWLLLSFQRGAGLERNACSVAEDAQEEERRGEGERRALEVVREDEKSRSYPRQGAGRGP